MPTLGSDNSPLLQVRVAEYNESTKERNRVFVS